MSPATAQLGALAAIAAGTGLVAGGMAGIVAGSDVPGGVDAGGGFVGLGVAVPAMVGFAAWALLQSEFTQFGHLTSMGANVASVGVSLLAVGAAGAGAYYAGKHIAEAIKS